MIGIILETAAIFLSIAGLSYLLGLGIAFGAERSVRHRLDEAGLDQRMQRCALLIGRFQQRREAMLPQLVRLDGMVKSFRRRQYMVDRRLSDLKVNRSRLIRVLGEDEAFARAERPSRRFVAHVINRHVQRALLEQKEHPFLARSWHRSQRVDVWAPTIGDAKALVERSYPPATGFFVVEISEPEQADADVRPFAAPMEAMLDRMPLVAGAA